MINLNKLKLGKLRIKTLFNLRVGFKKDTWPLEEEKKRYDRMNKRR